MIGSVLKPAAMWRILQPLLIHVFIYIFIYPLLTYMPSKYLYPFVRYKQTKCTRNTLHKGLLFKKKSLSYRKEENGLEIKKMQKCACLFMFGLPVEYCYLHFKDLRNFHP